MLPRTIPRKMSKSAYKRFNDYAPFHIMSSDSFHKVLHNRLVNTLCDIYVLPDDDEEDVRLRSETHVLDRVLFPVYQKVDQWLSTKPGMSCLDLGSARGDWIDQMAQRNPGADFTGVDLVPSRRVQTDARSTFEIQDINAGLETYHGSYDVVHARNLTHGIQRWSSFIVDAAETLLPNGLAIFIEQDYQIYNASKIPYKPTSPTYSPNARPPTFQVSKSSLSTPQLPALVHFLASVVRASSNAGSHITAVHHLAAFVERSHQFKNVETRDLWIPVVAASGADAAEKKTANEFRTAFVGFLGSCTPLLLSHGGYTTTELSMLEDAARIEVMAAKVPLYVRFIVVTAVKE